MENIFIISAAQTAIVWLVHPQLTETFDPCQKVTYSKKTKTAISINSLCSSDQMWASAAAPELWFSRHWGHRNTENKASVCGRGYGDPDLKKPAYPRT